MGDKPSSSVPKRQLKCAPKIPQRKTPKTQAPKPEERETHDEIPMESGLARGLMDQRPNYPVTLPLRRPSDGDQETLDRQEFDEASETLKECDGSRQSAAKELDQEDENSDIRMLFFQIPSILPIKPRDKNDMMKTSSGLHGLPAGYRGKMMIYKSGAIKMKLGDILFNVSPGINVNCPQDVVVINTENKHCCMLGGISKRIVVTPDINYLLNP